MKVVEFGRHNSMGIMGTWQNLVETYTLYAVDVVVSRISRCGHRKDGGTQNEHSLEMFVTTDTTVPSKEKLV